MKHNQNELRRQIDEKRNREMAEKNRELQEDIALENKVKEDLKRMNQKFMQEMSKEKGKHMNVNFDLGPSDRRG